MEVKKVSISLARYIYQLNARLWKAPQAILAMLVAPGTGRGCLLTFIEKSPHGSPHVQTCGMHHGCRLNMHARHQQLGLYGRAHPSSSTA